MSNYNLKAKNKKTGEIVEFSVDNRLITHYVGSYAYTEDQFNELYEPIEDPNHPYGGMEVEDNVPKETWRTRLYDLYVDNFFEPHDGQIEDFFQQELERIKNNFMTEFTDPDTGLLNISKYDHEEITNFFNKEIK